MQTYLDSLLVILDVIPVNVVVRTNGFFQLGANNVTGALSSSSTSEEHDTSTCILEGSLE